MYIYCLGECRGQTWEGKARTRVPTAVAVLGALASLVLGTCI